MDTPPARIRGTHIAVWGHSGSGKSTLARELGGRIGLPVAELDALFHTNPNWVDASREEFRANVTAFMDANPAGWVIEGNYHGMVGDLIRERTETLIWLRLPFRVVYPRLAWRRGTAAGAAALSQRRAALGDNPAHERQHFRNPVRGH